MKFQTFTPETAPEGSRPILAATAKAMGFVPNLLATMAGSPALLTAYTTLSRIYDESSLSPAERQIVLIAASRSNACEYCVAAHTVIAGMQRVPAAVVQAVRDGTTVADPKLEALRRFATIVAESRGWPDADAQRDFEAAGYGPQQALEVVLGVGLKTLSNYTNHIAHTPLDAAFSPAKWTRAA